MKLRKRQPRECTSSRRVSAYAVLAVLAAAAAPSWALSVDAAALDVTETDIDLDLPLDWKPEPNAIAADANVHNFQLRHIFHHGTYLDPRLHLRYDVESRGRSEGGRSEAHGSSYHNGDNGDNGESGDNIIIPVRSSMAVIERLADRSHARIEEHLAVARLTGQAAELDADEWTVDAVPAPDVSDRDTVINLALIASNAYAVDPDDGDWKEVGQGFNHSRRFGWDGDGLRGHVFADESNSTVVVSLKGTSPAVFDGEGTTTGDKINDNLFFSCCCGQGGQFFWRQVCDCYESTYTCDVACVERALRAENRYYRASIELYTNITQLYPDANVWVVGHSLGGAVSSLLGMTFGLPVVTFEAPGDDLAARRLGLPRPPPDDTLFGHRRRRYTGSVHIGHTADPVFLGTCNGATATCTLGGYAMESQCHTGLQCVYDPVGDWGWRVGIGYHKIHNVIDHVLRKYPTVPACVPDDECVDCFNWKYFRGNRSHTTTSSSSTTTTPSSTTKTRTTTCKTPGWWGCLDESTTTTGTTSTQPVVTTTYTTTTCITPGWFGCNEERNITITTTTLPPTTVPATTTAETATAPSPTSPTRTCLTPGWFGCKDKTASPTTTHSPTSTPARTSPPSSSKPSPTSCRHPFFFGYFCLGSTTEELDL